MINCDFIDFDEKGGQKCDISGGAKSGIFGHVEKGGGGKKGVPGGSEKWQKRGGEGGGPKRGVFSKVAYPPHELKSGRKHSSKMSSTCVPPFCSK